MFTLVHKRVHASLCVTFFFLFSHFVFAQKTATETSVIRGIVIDRNSEAFLENVSVELMDISPRKATTTNTEGVFVIDEVPVGRHRIRVSVFGYQEKIVADLLVEAGGRINLKVALEEEIRIDRAALNEIPTTANTGKKIVLSNETTKDKPNNSMAGISARPFTIEEVTRYAGARFDPARMVTNYAGAAGYDDSRNDIVIRGNSPSQILWQIEELPIENPNHVTTIGTSGGTTPILNVFALGESDFNTGAFAAQYGNALAGVFDLKLRNGDASRFGGMGQLGTQRAEVLIEGPLNKANRGGSFLLSLRSATGSYLLSSLIPVDPAHQDFNLKISTGRQNWGELDFFAIGGISLVNMPYQQNTYPQNSGTVFVNATRQAFFNKVKYDIFEYESYRHQNLMGLAGLKYTAQLSKKTFWRTIVGISQHQANVRWVLNQEDSTGVVESTSTTYTIKDRRNNYMLHSYINSKINNRISIRAGLLSNIYDLHLNEVYLLDGNTEYDYNGIFALTQAYLQSKIYLAPNLIMNIGLHSQYLTLNKKITAEPRFSLNWEFIENHTLSFGYGWHQQMVPYVSSFYQPKIGTDSNGQPIYYRGHPQLNFMSSQHLGLSYDWHINDELRLRIEGYAQFLDKIPVEQDSSAYSQLNFGATFYDLNSSILQSKGKGRNWGVELTVEKFFSDNFYGLLSASYFDSKYQGSDGQWRDTRFNYRYIANFLFGKEFLLGKMKRNVLFTDIRFSTTGGKPYTPIDLQATFDKGDYTEVYVESETNAKRLRPFYQVDFKIGIRINGKSTTHSFKVDLFNVFNIQNPLTVRYSERFNPLGSTVLGTEQIIYQRGFIPDITYTIQF